MTAAIRITKALTATAEIIGTNFSEAALTVIVNDLASHPENDVLAALVRCRREVKYRLTLADILQRMPVSTAPNTVPTDPDMAWELAVRLRGQRDESDTLVVPVAIMQAWPSALWEKGDAVAARMAFKASYPSRRIECGEKWQVSLGHDARRRESAVHEARKLGQITGDRAVQILGYDPAGDDAALPHSRTSMSTNTALRT